MKDSRTRASRRWTTLGGISVVLAIVSVAFAAPWTAESEGSATAKAGKLQPVAATAATPTQDLFPGESGDAAVSLANPNPVQMMVTSIVGNGAITSSSADCDAAGHGVTFTDQTGSWFVGKNATVEVSLPDAVQMSLESADVCQDVTFSIPVRVTASITNNSPAQSTTTTTAAPPPQIVMPASVTFDPTPAGSSSTRTISVTNGSNSPAQVMLGPITPAEFQYAGGNCSGATLAPGASCEMTVRFAPHNGGVKSGTLSARLNTDSVYSQTNLSGEGLVPQLSISPAQANYAATSVSSPANQTITFQVSNNGTAYAGPINMVLGGANPGEFVTTAPNFCQGTSLPPGGSCQITVRFAPQGYGNRSATLTAQAQFTSTTATLTGTGT